MTGLSHLDLLLKPYWIQGSELDTLPQRLLQLLRLYIAQEEVTVFQMVHTQNFDK